jgi:Lysylphosphatidylglycerol synthase TM region
MAVIGTALFAWSISALGLAKIQDAFVRIGWGFGAILLLSGAREAVRTLAWTRTIEGPVRLSFQDAFRARLAGEALNNLLPMGMLVGEPMKAEHVGHRLPFATAFSALVVEFAFYGVSLVLLFGAGVVTLFPSSAVLFVAVIALMIVPLVRNGNGRTGIAEPRDSSGQHVANVITRVLEKMRRLGDPVLRFAVLDPGRAWRLVVLEAAFQLFAVAEVYLTLALITPQHVAWSSALALETVSRAVTILFKMLPMRLGVDEAGAAVVADRLGLGSASGITLALVRRMRSLCWSAVGIVFVLMRSTWRPGAPVAVAISSARP